MASLRDGNAVLAAVRMLLFAALALLAAAAHAWGTQGHQVVALLAEQQLTPKAKEQVLKLLALEPGATLASISTWADKHRNRTTGPWHYVNLPRGDCTYGALRDCPDGNCVVEAINRQLAVLASDAPDEKRLTALKYVVHFVADVHQPLHAGYADDRGGNTYQVQAFGRGTNLHALWDTGLIQNLGLSSEGLAATLAAVKVGDVNLDMARAAEESCKIVGEAGFYPARKLGADYVSRYTPVMERRLATAGARLAGLMNRIFQ